MGASVWASGSQVCSGNTGTLTANATTKPRNSTRAVVSDSTPPSAMRTRSKVTPPPSPAPDNTARATMHTSMSAEPAIVNRKNLLAA